MKGAVLCVYYLGERFNLISQYPLCLMTGYQPNSGSFYATARLTALTLCVPQYNTFEKIQLPVQTRDFTPHSESRKNNKYIV